MSLKGEFERYYKRNGSQKFGTLSTRQHVHRLALMGPLLLATAGYLYLTFVVGAFRDYANDVMFGLLQLMVTFGAIAVFSLSLFRVVESLRCLATAGHTGSRR